ncbi:MAG: formylglycine-generating enzyme family protein, partial [Deltaproteobacteria bacterium]|nr:formylglycine-generating enzyme family protein [Deltaproteobacteria bacterium]
PSWCGALDMGGNVREIVADCYSTSYKDAPLDGTPQTTCEAVEVLPVVRGGYYGSKKVELRSSYRTGCTALPTVQTGTRCARQGE